MTAGPRAHVAWQLRDQADSCEAMGSPLYAGLLQAAARDVEAGGPTWGVLSGHVAPGRGDALALRLMAAVHRLVLTGQAPRLARQYPSAGGQPTDDAWPAFRAVLEDRAPDLAGLVVLPCQTNEVGRCAGLVWGFLDVAAASGLPLRVLEVGASAGLNLRWDHFRYGGGGVSWGDPASPVDLSGLWAEAPPALPSRVEVVERRGCDRRSVDIASPDGRLALQASVWADQTVRLQRLRGALELASRVPAVVDEASLDAWLPGRLAHPPSGASTIVYHSVVEEYLPADVRGRFHACLAEAGGRATPKAPLAWVRVEPLSAVRHHGVTLTTWPGGQERLLAVCGAHGTDVRLHRI
jgi:hypothetical protein